jgi:NitT/TauT family transport system ATP-binding protein
MNRAITMLEAIGVTKYFVYGKHQHVVQALADVTLRIADAEFVAIIGPSGCGKTTLLRAFAGLVLPDEGEVRLAGQKILRPSPERAMVFQQFALLPWADVVSNVAFGLQLRGMSRRDREECAHALVRKVGLEGFERSLPHQLSGGMQQRVGLARALAVDPKVLLMDEPFGALDDQTKHVLWTELLRIWEVDRKTVAFVTHSMNEAITLADRVVVMSRQPGRIVEIIDVDIPRPRPTNIESAPQYADLKQHLWELLSSQIDEWKASGFPAESQNGAVS